MYGDQGLKVLAFPCNQFGGQEPGTHEEILKFSEKFNAREKFVWFEKGDVNGENAREVFTFLKDKIAFDNGGIPYKRIGSKTKVEPFGVGAIETLLKKKA